LLAGLHWSWSVTTMSDRTVTQTHGIQRGRTARQAGLSGFVTVGEYVGEVAADAAQAVRRAGLRPGLDRSFGCERDLIGLVVAQDPVTGGELVRNGMVTLYVAAPGNAPVDGPAEDTPGISDDALPLPDDAAAALNPAQGDATALCARGEARRARKPGLARQSTLEFGQAPEPVPRVGSRAARTVSPERDWSTPTDTYTTTTRDGGGDISGGRSREGDLYEPDTRELAREEVARANDLFAGETDLTTPWRRTYPRRDCKAIVLGGIGGVRASLAARPRVVQTVGVILAVLVVLVLIAILGAHPARTTTRSVTSHGGLRSVQTRTSEEHRPVLIPRARSGVPSRDTEVSRHRRVGSGSVGGDSTNPPVRDAYSVSPSTRRATPSRRTGAVERPTREQPSEGGPFSP
jgi:hypothetical protein